jgi:hypothetical protein
MNILKIRYILCRQDLDKLMTLIDDSGGVIQDSLSGTSEICLSFSDGKQLQTFRKQILIEFGGKYHYSTGKYAIIDLIGREPNVPDPKFEETVLEFIKDQKFFNANVVTFMQEQKAFNTTVMTFMQEQKAFNTTVMTFMQEQKVFNATVVAFMDDQKSFNTTVVTFMQEQKAFNDRVETRLDRIEKRIDNLVLKNNLKE